LKFVILGPTQAKISKINNVYRYRLALKCRNTARMRGMMTEILKSESKNKDYKSVSISVDINPNDIS
jgi:primosomal protein N' (replication factor Y)